MNKDIDALMEVVTALGRLRSFRDPLAGANVELTPAQMHAVLWLGLEGPLNHTSLGMRAGCSPSATTGVVDRLEKLGVVERIRDEEDRRVVLVQLTPRGEQLGALLRSFIRDRVASVLGALSADDRKALIGIAQRMLQAMESRAAPAPDVEASEEPTEDAP